MAKINVGLVSKGAGLFAITAIAAFLIFNVQAHSIQGKSGSALDGDPPLIAPTATSNSDTPEAASPNGEPTEDSAGSAQGYATAIFAGGCFWCIEADFEKVNGVLAVLSGYSGGNVDNPSYEQVTYENTGHYEAVEVRYNAATVDYRTLVQYFFRHIDPLDPNGQFCDKGSSYRTAIFPGTPEERTIAEEEKANVAAELNASVATKIIDRGEFWIAEEYHQDYYKKNALRYRLYRQGCGRDRRVEQLWGK